MKKLLFSLLIVFLSSYAFSGVVVTEKLSDGESVTYYQNGMIASHSGGKIDSLIDIKKKTIYTVDYESELIVFGSFEEMKEVQSLAAEQLKDIAEDGYYKEQSELVKKLKVKTVSKGKASYGGYPCEKILISLTEQGISTELCYSPQLLEEISKEVDMKTFTDILKNETTFFMNPEELVESEVMAYAYKGYTVYEKVRLPDFNGGVNENTTEVISVKKENVSESKFKLPAELTYISLIDLMSRYGNE
jgi:hypothetical protein